MKQTDVKDFINRVQETEIEIKVKDGKIEKNFAKGTAGSIRYSRKHCLSFHRYLRPTYNRRFRQNFKERRS